MPGLTENSGRKNGPKGDRRRSIASRSCEVNVLESLDLTEVQRHLETATSEFLDSLPAAQWLAPQTCCGIIARHTAVLEGNFIYWMAGAYLSAKTAEARSIIQENLRDEIADCHPAMVHRFAAAACARPTESDVTAVFDDLNSVRVFVGRLSGVPALLMMMYFEGLIQTFMPYLADLAARRGSLETKYTDVHGVCDIAHAEGLLRAIALGGGRMSPRGGGGFVWGVYLLRRLLETIVYGEQTSHRLKSAAQSSRNIGRTIEA
jgi:hypothetical protein